MPLFRQSPIHTRSFSQRNSPSRCNEAPSHRQPDTYDQEAHPIGAAAYEQIREKDRAYIIDEIQSPNIQSPLIQPPNTRATSQVTSHDLVNIRDQMLHVCNAVSTLEGAVTNINKNLAEQRARSTRRELRQPRMDDNLSSSGDEDEDVYSVTSHRENRPRPRPRITKQLKLPAFTGKESWTVWFNRFTDVASRQHLSSEEKLDEMLPRLQGQAGEFVYEQLSAETRRDYKALCRELHNRFRVIETAKSFKTQLSRRNQKSGESPEDFAADLKRLYDKAYPQRDQSTRREDLLRKFLDGCHDNKAIFHVEYIKEPSTIDEAVYEMICFREMKKSNTEERHREKYNRAAKAYEESDATDDEFQERQVTHVHLPNKKRLINRPSNDAQPRAETSSPMNDIEQLKQQVELLKEQLKKSQESKDKAQDTETNRYRNNPRRPFQHNRQAHPQRFACFNCGDPSHMIRECPHRGSTNQQFVQNIQDAGRAGDQHNPLNYNRPADRA